MNWIDKAAARQKQIEDALTTTGEPKPMSERILAVWRRVEEEIESTARQFNGGVRRQAMTCRTASSQERGGRRFYVDFTSKNGRTAHVVIGLDLNTGAMAVDYIWKTGAGDATQTATFALSETPDTGRAIGLSGDEPFTTDPATMAESILFPWVDRLGGLDGVPA